jgi:integrase
MQTINRLNNSLLVQPVMTVQRFVDTVWRDYLDQRGVKPSTIYSYDSMLQNLVLPSFGQKIVDQITPVRLSLLFKAAREKKYSPKTLLNLYSLLKVIFEVTRELDLIEASQTAEAAPAQSRAHGKAELHARPTSWLGLRLGELLALCWANLERQTLEIRRSLWRGKLQATPKTRASQARISLPNELAVLLAGHRQQSKWSGD